MRPLLATAFAAALATSAQAASFDIALTQNGIGDVGPDWFGMVEAEASGMVIFASFPVGGFTYDTISGFTLQASSPKNIAFFVAILQQFVSPDAGVAFQLVVLGVVAVLLELPVLVFYGLASALSARLMRERIIEWIEAVGGGILLALGGALANSQRGS